MARTRVKKQHFVPCCYLKNFCAHKKQLFVFDKPLGKTYRSSVDDVANEVGFYDIPPEHGIEMQAVEHAFSDVETTLSRMIGPTRLRAGICGKTYT